MFSLLNFGFILWLWYGLSIGSYPIIIANAVTMVFAIYILVTKVRLDILTTKEIKNN